LPHVGGALFDLLLCGIGRKISSIKTDGIKIK
jgi:hypothetical protein